MSKQVVFQWLTGFGSFWLIIFFVYLMYSSPSEQQIQPTFRAQGSPKEIESTAQRPQIPIAILNIKDIQKAGVSFKETPQQRITNQQREIIRREMAGYQYPDGKYNISARKFEDLLIKENGRPIRSIILSTWRSGSSFLGAILNAHPGSFHHFEPLADFGDVQVRDSPLAAKAIKRVKALLNCEYADLDKMIEYGKTNSLVFDRNPFLWKKCMAYEGLCYNHSFLSGMCELFPFQSMKLVRLRLHAAEELLADEKLAIRLVLLVRDPRGTIQSRNRLEFCQKSSECSDPAVLCTDLVSDYRTAVELQQKYPNTFRVLRYEDLIKDLYEQVEDLCRFYGRDFHPNVKKFLATHTITHIADPYGVFRNSKDTPFHWKTDLKFEEVEKIQRTCATALKHWGYSPAINATHLIKFNPVTNYDLNL